MKELIAVIRDGKRIILLLCLLMATAFVMPFTAYAQDSGETVRVGWYDSPFNTMDQFERRSGYAYEYQCKIAAYTGWNYEYVEGSWADLIQMMENGEIDLLSDVSYTKDRAEKMLYSSLPMGAESYYLYVSPDNTEISSDDYSTLNGKKVGVTKNSIEKDLFVEWARKRGIETEIVDLKGSDQLSLEMLKDGEIDVFITISLEEYSDDSNAAVPICKIGSSDFFFVVNKERPDLLAELDSALSKIQDEDQNFNQQLFDKYLWYSTANRYLSTDEKEWLSNHGAIRVGYQDNYLAFCAQDESTGELTGALKDYLDYAADSMEGVHIDFEAVAYPTAAAAISAMNNGEVDCMFPANLTSYDGEMLGVVMTPALMTTEMDAVVRDTEQKAFLLQDDIYVAVNRGNTNYEMFLKDHFPDWKVKYFDNTQEGLTAIANGDADCVIISNYRFSNISKQCEKLHLTTVYTGVDMDYCLAVHKGDTELYSILTKMTKTVPDSTIHAALTYYSTEDAKTSFIDIVKENLVAVLLGITVIALLIVLLLYRSIRAEKKAMEEERLVNDLNKRVFVDALTSVRNKGAFADYLQDLQDKVDNGELTDLAIAVFDCDDLKMVNDDFGHEKGDIYLKSASHLICRVFQHSPVFRIGGDEFSAVLLNDDFQNRDELAKEFEAAKTEICASSENKWEQVRVSLGIAVYSPDADRSVNDTARRADKIMYENKRASKESR